MLDLYNRLSFVLDTAINGGVYKTAQTGGAFDTQSLNSGANQVVAEIIAGTVTDGTHTFVLQDTNDTTGVTDSWNPVVAPLLQGTSPTLTTGAGNGANTVTKIGYLGIKRYLRIVSAESGATGAQVTVVWVVGQERNLPAA